MRLLRLFQLAALAACLLTVSGTLSAQSGPNCGKGTTIALADGATEIYNCSGASFPGALSFRTNSFHMPYVLVVTDLDTIIRHVERVEREIDFSALPGGNYLVFALYFKGPLYARAGMDATADRLAGYCWGLTDNAVAVSTLPPDGGQISSDRGAGPLYICPGDTIPDLLTLSTTSTSQNYQFFLTDTNNVILDLIGAQVDLNGLATGFCRIWGAAYLGDLTAAIGDTLGESPAASACAERSANFIPIVKAVPDAGQVNNAQGGNQLLFCDGDAGVIELENANAAPLPYAFILTDTNNNILEVLPGNTADFAAYPIGTYRLWGVSYTGSSLLRGGLNAATEPLSDDCFDLSDTFVAVTIQALDAGRIELDNGDTTRLLCIQSGFSDTILSFISTATGEQSFRFVVTNTDDEVLLISDTNAIDFLALEGREFKVKGLAYTGNLLLQVGDNTGEVIPSDKCNEYSRNTVHISRRIISGGNIRLAGGGSQLQYCFGTTEDQTIAFDLLNQEGDRQALIITDTNNVILNVVEGAGFTITQALPNDLRVWGLAYSGALAANTGMLLNQAVFSDECFETSSDFVSIRWDEVDGGRITLEDGSTRTSICVMDQREDLLSFQTTSQSASRYVYLLTDEADRLIFTLIGNTIDFDVAEAGISKIWGLSLTGTFLGRAGDTITQTVLSTGCFQLSENAVEIKKDIVNGGSVWFADSTTTTEVCREGLPDILSFINDGNTTGIYSYLITDPADNFLQAAVGTDNFNFDAIALDRIKVWGLAHTGTIILQPGESIFANVVTDGCYSLSTNALVVNKTFPVGGTVALPSGATDTLLCPLANAPALVTMQPAFASSEHYAFLLTDESNLVIDTTTGDRFDLSFLAEGTYRIWGLAYGGNLLARPGAQAATTPLADDCFALSDNFITVSRLRPEAGVLLYNDGAMLQNTCPQDGQADIIRYSMDNVANGQTLFLLVDGFGAVAALTSADSMDVDSLPAGAYNLFGAGITGTVTIQVGDTLFSQPLSDQCATLSDNNLVLIHETPEGGTVSLSEGIPSGLCVGDGVADQYSFFASGQSNTPYAFLVTDTANVLLATLVNTNAVDLEAIFEGDIRIWGLAYTGNLLAEPGDTVSLIPLTDDCYDLSDNFIGLERQEVEGGKVTTASGLTTYYSCPEDPADLVQFATTSRADNSNYAFLIANTSDIVLAVMNGNEQNLDIIPFAEVRIYGISYAGDLNVGTGTDLKTGNLATGCYQVSENFVRVVKGTPAGGSISTADGQNDALFCPGTGSDFLHLRKTTTSDAGFVYILTTTDSVVLDIFTADSIHMTEQPVGNYRILGLSYTGNLLISAGDTLTLNTLYADNCNELAAAPILVERGGAVIASTVETFDGETLLYTCPMDGIGDVVVVQLPDDLGGAGYRIVITDDQDRVQFPDIAGQVLNFDPVTPGIYRIYGVSFTGNFFTQFGADIRNTPLSNNCYRLSDNYITVVAVAPEGGTVQTVTGADSLSVSLGNPLPDTATIVAQGASAANYTFLLTEADTRIVRQIAADGFFQFDSLAPGSYRIAGLSFTGDLRVETGISLIGNDSLATSCFDLSDNEVRVTVNTMNQPFALPAAPVVGQDPQLTVRVFPNPVSGTVNVRFNLPPDQAGENVELQLLDPNGRVLLTQRIKAISGYNESAFDLEGLRPGMYLLRIQGDRLIATQRVIKTD